MKRLLFTPAAQSDIADIWDYSADQWSVDQADRYTSDIHDLCLALAAGRKQGRTVQVRAGYLKCPVGAHMVYFCDFDDRIEIIRILHGRQDRDRHL